MKLKAAAQYKSAGVTVDFSAIQRHHTQNVLRRIIPYFARRSGATIKLMAAQTDINKPFIVLRAPHANRIYDGEIYVDPVTGAAGFLTEDGWRSRKGVKKVPSGRQMKYNTSHHPKAGPYPDQRLVQEQGKALVADLQRFIDSGRAFK